MASLTCPNCRNTLNAPESASSATCPTCGATVPVPVPAPIETPVPAATSAPVAAAAAATAPAAAKTARVYDNTPEAVGDGKFRPFLPRAIDFVIDKLRGVFSESLFNTVSRLALMAGEFLMYPALLIILLVYIITAFRGKSTQPAFYGLGLFFVGLLALYIALQLIVAGFKLLKSNPSRIANRIYLNCFVVIFLLIGVYCLLQPIMAYYQYIGPRRLNAFAFWWLSAIPAFLGAALALNPAILNINVSEDATAGETFLGIVAFALKSALALLPVLLATGAIIIIYACIVSVGYYLFSDDKFTGDLRGAIALAQAEGQLYLTLTLPIFVTLTVLLYYLIVDLCQAILSIPRNRVN